MEIESSYLAKYNLKSSKYIYYNNIILYDWKREHNLESMTIFDEPCHCK